MAATAGKLGAPASQGLASLCAFGDGQAVAKALGAMKSTEATALVGDASTYGGSLLLFAAAHGNLEVHDTQLVDCSYMCATASRVCGRVRVCVCVCV